MKERNKRLATKMEIFKYSFGGIGSNISFALLMSYLMFFYTDIFGISSISVGSLFLIARLIDAVTDPVMGMIADRTRTKFGKYRPWIIFIAPFLGLSVILLFFTPDIGYDQKVIYAYVTYILYSIISTMVNIPYHALTPVLSEDSNQRTQIASAKQMMAIPANLFVSVAALPLVAFFGDGKQGWLGLAIVVAVLTIISFWLCASGAKRHDVIVEDSVKKTEKVSLKSQLSVIYRNKPLLLLMGAFGVQMLATAVSNSVNMYYMKYNVGRADLIPLIGLIGTFASVPVAVILPALSKRFDKKMIFIVGNIISAITCFLLFLTPVDHVVLVVIVSVLVTATAQVSGIIGWAMLPDCVDYAQWKLGIRGDGTVSSSLTFINKCGMAFGGLIAGAAMQAVGYVAGTQQTAIVLNSILTMKSIVPAAAYLIAIFLIMKYPITNRNFKDMINDIEERKDAAGN